MIIPSQIDGLSAIGLPNSDGIQRKMANWETYLCWKINQLVKNYGSFWIEFIEKGLRNPGINQLLMFLYLFNKTG